MEEHKNHISKTAEDKKNLYRLINGTEYPMWLVDRGCIILECNQSFQSWVSHFIGRQLSPGDHVLYGGMNKNYLEKFEMCYELALNGSAFKSVEDMQIENETRYTTVSFNPVFDDGRVIGVSCFARDITEQRQHLLKIEEQNIALKEIAFIESHKVRGAVATILGLEQLFNYDEITDPENKEILSGIAKVVRELDEIVREVVRKSNAIEK